MRGILLCAIHWAGGHSPGTQAALDTQTDALNDTSVRALLEATESQDLTGAFSREEALEEMDTTWGQKLGDIQSSGKTSTD